jgi:hypothetical protein
MKTATGLTLVAIGAIFAFAVTAHPSWINLQIAGWVIMLTGIIGMAVPKRGYGWLRRRVIVREPQQPADGKRPAAITGTVVGDQAGPEDLAPPPAAGGEAPDQAPPGTTSPRETIEEFYEE